MLISYVASNVCLVPSSGAVISFIFLRLSLLQSGLLALPAGSAVVRRDPGVGARWSFCAPTLTLLFLCAPTRPLSLLRLLLVWSTVCGSFRERGVWEASSLGLSVLLTHSLAGYGFLDWRSCSFC